MLRKIVYLVLILFCVLLSSVNAMTNEERKILENSGNSYFNNHVAIAQAKLTINKDNTVNVWISPAVPVNIFQSIGATANWYATAYHVFPDIGTMYITIESDQTGIIKGYALPKWAASLRWNGENVNEDDLLTLALKITKTMK